MNYWKECIEEALEDAGIETTDEQIYTVTRWVVGAHENYGMAHGYHAIPNPRDTEIESLEKKIKKIEDSHQRQLYGIREGVAKRRGVEVHDVWIESDGSVKYDRR